MKRLLTFWVIYLFAILIIYLSAYNPSVKQPDVGIKQSTVYLITQLEGLKKEAYDDGFGNMTIGVGHLIKPDEAHLYYTKLTHKEAHKLLLSDMEHCSRTIDTKVLSPLTQPQFDALMSFCHNIGVNRFARSNVIRQINSQNYKAAADAMLDWNKPSGLLKRRQKERKLFLQGA